MGFWPQILGNQRLLLVIYIIALVGLLIFPIDVPNFRLLNIEADKWVHFVLFGGLAIFLQWNLSVLRHSVLISIGVAFVVAVATEIAQSLVEYRSAEWWDLLADLFGAVLGALFMRRLLSRVTKKSVGLLTAILGFNVGAFFVLADLIGVGDSEGFGIKQMVGTALGALIIIGGVTIYVSNLAGETSRS